MLVRRDELREPLLANGTADDDVEAGPPAKVPPPPPSSSADSDDEAEVEEEGYWARLCHLWSSPLVATTCCIFLCYILKVVQQVRALQRPPQLPPLTCRGWGPGFCRGACARPSAHLVPAL
jgi:hypothetical protein